MLSAEDFVKEQIDLVHEYDPIARRERYLRTRKLKGRAVANIPPSSRPTTDAKDLNPVKPKVKTKSQAARKREKANARVRALEGKLDQLREVLRILVEQSKARSGVETKKQAESRKEKDTKESKTPDKPKTASQKREDAKRAKENREKNESPSQKAAKLQTEIRNIQDRIQEAREELRSKSKTKKKPQPTRKQTVVATKTRTASNGR